MTILDEGNLQIVASGAVAARRFDGPSHGLTCMKAVDFVIELTDSYLFIEVKDPQDPAATQKRQERFLADLKSGKLNQALKYKFRDSFLYEWALDRANKPIDYLVLIALDSLTGPELANRSDALRRELPLVGPSSKPWARPFVRSCLVLNIDWWNRVFPQLPVSRRSSQP